MRKVVFCILAGALTALVIARALLPESARAVMAADGELYGYNLCEVSLPLAPETAGSALLADMNGYYLFRTPTAKNAWTGVLAGRNLILICAENWVAPTAPDRYAEPALYRLDRGSAGVSSVYRTDWYQGSAGLSFALLTGVVPTTMDGETALVYAGRQDTYLPFALARCLSAAGYASFACIRENSQRAGFETLGFETVTVCGGSAEETLAETPGDVTDAPRFFAYYLWADEDGTAALEQLLDTLKSSRRLKDTVICLYTGAETADRAHLYIYSSAVADAVSARPCSALDVTPTLLNLFGIDYDSRFLSGADVFAQNSETGTVSAVTPLVSLYGSAYSDWVTDAGYYSAEGNIFRQTADCFESSADVSAYVHEAAQMVYDRYIYARKTMEYDYFRLVLP